MSVQKYNPKSFVIHKLGLHRKLLSFLTALVLSLFSPQAKGVCDPSRLWDAGGWPSVDWNTNANWSGDNEPDSNTESALIMPIASPPTSNKTVTIDCFYNYGF